MIEALKYQTDFHKLPEMFIFLENITDTAQNF